MSPLTYPAVMREAERGHLVVIVPGRRGQDLRVVWGSFALPPGSAEKARDPDPTVGIGLMLGVISEVRRIAQRTGFTPA